MPFSAASSREIRVGALEKGIVISTISILSGVMMKVTAGLLLLTIGFVLAGPAGADDVQTLPDGVALTVGGDRVELRVASPHAFRLHIFAPDAPVPAPSIFLNGLAQPAMPHTVVHDGTVIGLKTAFGELRVDSSRQTWSLLDGTGKTLLGWGPWGIGDFKTPSDHLGLSEIRCAPGEGSAVNLPRYYGSGSAPHFGDILKTQSPGIMGDGWTSLPQYWSSVGYGALMIGQSDDQPANWNSKPDGSVLWGIHGPDIDLYLAPAPNLYEWLRDQAELTGFAPVPPRWALGYLQSRWGWKDKDYIDDTLARFRKDKLPVDAFIFDFEWYTKTPDYKVGAAGDPNFLDFGWNPVLFPDPAAQIADFARNGLHMVGIRKPRLGNSATLVMARSKGWILPSPYANLTQLRNLDFKNSAVRTWYEDRIRKFDEAGVAAFWNDEGELSYSEYSYWNLAEVDLLKQVKPDARFWSINRAYSPGLQRFGAAVWSGDIGSDWATLAETPGHLLADCLAGLPYSACDIGGFGGTPSPELLVRWMQAGVFFPVMRSHSTLSQTPRFPWLYGPDAENAIRQAIDLRYRLIPYYDSLAHANHRTAAPLMRPLVMEFPDDTALFNRSDEWLVGRGLLTAPFLQAGGSRQVYLPHDRWFAFETNHATDGPKTLSITGALDKIPIYVRAGTLLPLGPVVQDTEEKSAAPLELEIYPGRDASFDLVEDDGKTLDYQTGQIRMTHFTWDDHAKRLNWTTEGSYDGANRFRAMKVVLFEPQGRVEKPAKFSGSGSVAFTTGSPTD